MDSALQIDGSSSTTRTRTNGVCDIDSLPCASIGAARDDDPADCDPCTTFHVILLSVSYAELGRRVVRRGPLASYLGESLRPYVRSARGVAVKAARVSCIRC